MNRLRVLLIGTALIMGGSLLASAQPKDHRDGGYSERDRYGDKRYYRDHDGDRDDRRFYGDRDDRRRFDRDDRGRKEKIWFRFNFHGRDWDHDGDRH